MLPSSTITKAEIIRILRPLSKWKFISSLPIVNSVHLTWKAYFTLFLKSKCSGKTKCWLVMNKSIDLSDRSVTTQKTEVNRRLLFGHSCIIFSMEVFKLSWKGNSVPEDSPVFFFFFFKRIQGKWWGHQKFPDKSFPIEKASPYLLMKHSLSLWIKTKIFNLPSILGHAENLLTGHARLSWSILRVCRERNTISCHRKKCHGEGEVSKHVLPWGYLLHSSLSNPIEWNMHTPGTHWGPHWTLPVFLILQKCPGPPMSFKSLPLLCSICRDIIDISSLLTCCGKTCVTWDIEVSPQCTSPQDSWRSLAQCSELPTRPAPETI